MAAPIIMGGGSNAGRLGVLLDNIGRPAVDVTSSGWTLTPANVNIIKGLLEAECITKPDSPVVIYALDNSCFMNMVADGTISPIKKLEDGKYHMVGDLAITPGILLRPMYAALDKIIKICGNRRIYITTPLPRYILVPCCEDSSHCINLVVKDDATRQEVFNLMEELELELPASGEATRFLVGALHPLCQLHSQLGVAGFGAMNGVAHPVGDHSVQDLMPCGSCLPFQQIAGVDHGT
jgi:hypothetical protein